MVWSGSLAAVVEVKIKFAKHRARPAAQRRKKFTFGGASKWVFIVQKVSVVLSERIESPQRSARRVIPNAGRVGIEIE